MRLVVISIFFVAMLAGCSASRFVKPLDCGQHAVTASFGGPLIRFGGTVIPIPLTSVGYGYGVDTNLTLFGNLHTTSLLYGTGQIEAGICWNVVTVKRFGLNAALSANMTMDKWQKNFRAWPVVDLNATFDRKQSGYWYVGLNNWIEFAKQRSHGVNQERQLIFSPQIGHMFVKEKWRFQLEAKYILPYVKNQPNAVEYIGINHYGATGIYFGLYRTF